MKKNRRKDLFIYKSLQILLLKVVVASCLLSVLSVLSASGFFYLFILKSYSENQTLELFQLINQLGEYKTVYFIFVVSGLVFSAGLIVYAWLKLSHRVAGPLHHIRKNLNEYIESDEKDFTPIALRKHDELHDLAQLINQALEKKSNKTLK